MPRPSPSSRSHTQIHDPPINPVRRLRPRRHHLLSLPDDVLRRIFLHLLHLPPTLPTALLSNRSLDSYEYALWLARAHPVLARVLLSLVRALHISWYDPITPNDIAFISPSLTSLSITRHSSADHFLNTLSQPSPPLRTLVLDNVSVSSHSLLSILSNASLHSLTLSFVCIPYLSATLTALAPSCVTLQHLHLRGMSDLDARALLALCTAAAPSIQTLSLRYLRNRSLDDHVLHHLSTILPNLSSLSLEHLRHVSTNAIISFISIQASSLRSLQLFALDLPIHRLAPTLSTASNLTHLALHCPHAPRSHMTPEAILALLHSHPHPHLYSLHLSAIPMLSNHHLIRVLPLLPPLRIVHLTRCVHLTHHAIDALVRHHKPTLEDIDLRGCPMDDQALLHISNCPNLLHIALGSFDDLFYHDISHFTEARVTDAGMRKFLSSCGSHLRTFVWETPRVLTSRQPPLSYLHVGVDNFSAKALAHSLSAFCPRLQRIEVNWLRPPAAAGRSAMRAACDLAFFALEAKLPHAAIFVDKEVL